MTATISTASLAEKLSEWAESLSAQAKKYEDAGNQQAQHAAAYRSDLLRVAAVRLTAPQNRRSVAEAQIAGVRDLLDDEKFLELSPAQIRETLDGVLNIHEGMES